MNPNNLIIVIDDLAWHDVNGATDVVIPNIHAFRDSSLNFTDHHAPGASCTPSRCGILTGNYPHRYNLRDNVKYIDTRGIPSNVNTLARHFSANGYETQHIGKWMLGWSEEEYRPLGAGFDKAFWFPHGAELANGGNPTGRTYIDPFIRNGEEEPEERIGHITEILTDKCITKMGSLTEPWLITLWHYSCHAPHMAPSEWTEKFPNTDRGHFLANLAHLDEQIGRVLKAVPENTIVIITSDNGGEATYHPNGQYWRGNKGTAYEAGHRVPFMFKAPQTTPGTTNALSSHLDIFPTLSSLCGLSVPSCDGLNNEDVWTGVSATGDETRRLFWEFEHENGQYITSGQRRKEYKMVDGEFYKLDTDPQETTDVATTYPDKVITFNDKMDEWRLEVYP